MLVASPRAYDVDFARRVSLDVLGHIPRYAELVELIDSKAPDRRERFVEKLLDDEDYVRNWTTIWGNLLIGRTNNQGGRQALDRWLRRAFARNMPYDRFVSQLITAEGDTGENGATGYYLRDGQMRLDTVSATAQVFLGTQIGCAQCHDHKYDPISHRDFYRLFAFFNNGPGKGLISAENPPPLILSLIHI